MLLDASITRSSLISDPPGLTFTDLKPGDVVDKTVTVTNAAPYPVELSSQVTRDGALFQGAHPLVVSFDLTRQNGDAGTCPGVEDALAADATAIVHVHARFPAAAGNEYQSQSGTATLFFTAAQLTPEECGGTLVSPPIVAGTPPRLPSTGIDASGVLLLAVALCVLGVLVRTVVARNGRSGRYIRRDVGGAARMMASRLRLCLAVVLGLVLLLAAVPASSAALTDSGAVQTGFASTASVPLDFTGGEAGDDYSMGWTSDGRLYAWGANDRGQLGLGDTVSRSSPTRVPFAPGVSIASASAGINMSIALSTTGDVYTWGNSDVSPSGPTPGVVPELSGQGVIGVSAGGFFFLAWTADGRLYSWGNNGGGRLGRAGTGNLLTPAPVTAQGIDTHAVQRAVAGRFFAAAVVDGGTSDVGWGSFYNAETGDTFTGLPADSPVVGLNAGNSFLFAWTADGRLFSGASTFALSYESELSGVTVRGAAVSMPVSGASSFFVWNDQLDLYSWGLNSSGQLGLGDTVDRAEPTLVTLPPGAHVEDLAEGNAHALFVGTDGSYSAAGSNSAGQLGTHDTAQRDTFSFPVLIERWP